jgi:hypothetical protein
MKKYTNKNRPVNQLKMKDKKKDEYVTKAQVEQIIKAQELNLTKWTGYQFAVGSLGNASAIQAITMPTTGNGENSMSGNSINIEGFELRYYWRDVVGSSDAYANRVVIFQAVGNSAPTLGTLVQYTSNASIAQVSPFNYDNLNKEYRILFDKTTSNDTYNPVTSTVKKFAAKVHKCKFDTVSNSWANGQIFLWYNNTTSGATADNTLTLVLKTIWSDV